MLILLLIFLLQAWAAPVSTGPQTAPTFAHAVIWGVEARNDASGIAERTMYSIIRSCLLTIAACVYRAIHQNVPDPKASWGDRQSIRMKITFYAVLAPEVMVWWAMRQWFGAKEVADQVNKAKPELNWGRTHGHFAQMGGLGRFDNERILYPPTLIELLKNGQIDVEELKRVSKKRIEDHSKGDILSKGIIALQTTWFVFECLARLHQGLPLLELEIVTLAFATLNTLTYLFWWDKPLNVLCPIYLHVLPAPHPPSEASRSSAPSPIEQASLKEVSSDGKIENYPLLERTALGMKKQEDDKVVTGRNVRERGRSRIWKQVIKPPLTRVFRAAWNLPLSVGRTVQGAAEVVKADVKKRGWWATGWKWLIEAPFLTVASPPMELLFDTEVDEEATHVSTFYGMKISRSKERLVIILCCLIGTIFGAIHFLSWFSVFPTHTEFILWRISSIALVAQPLCLMFELAFGAFAGKRGLAAYVFSILPLALGLIVYIPARLCILVLAFLALRDLPSGSFQTISWTTYIPHL